MFDIYNFYHMWIFTLFERGDKGLFFIMDVYEKILKN